MNLKQFSDYSALGLCLLDDTSTPTRVLVGCYKRHAVGCSFYVCREDLETLQFAQRPELRFTACLAASSLGDLGQVDRPHRLELTK